MSHVFSEELNTVLCLEDLMYDQNFAGFYYNRFENFILSHWLLTPTTANHSPCLSQQTNIIPSTGQYKSAVQSIGITGSLVEV